MFIRGFSVSHCVAVLRNPSWVLRSTDRFSLSQCLLADEHLSFGKHRNAEFRTAASLYQNVPSAPCPDCVTRHPQCPQTGQTHLDIQPQRYPYGSWRQRTSVCGVEFQGGRCRSSFSKYSFLLKLPGKFLSLSVILTLQGFCTGDRKSNPAGLAWWQFILLGSLEQSPAWSQLLSWRCARTYATQPMAITPAH